MKCRFCTTPLSHIFADLGFAPPSNSYIDSGKLDQLETYYPLKIWTCESCFLTQIDEFKSHSDIFSDDYAYFSSFSTAWVKHAEEYSQKMIAKFNLDENSNVVEVASNDGYLLQFFKQQNIPCLGVEPTSSTAKEARKKGVETREMFFGKSTATKLKDEGLQADLMAANNVLAHVPDINDFVAGFKILLKPEGVITFEFPHLLQLVENNQFDTIYHEHFSYLSLMTVKKIVEKQGLRVFDVEELWTHGGSLRVYATHKNATHQVQKTVDDILQKEQNAGMADISFYSGFQTKIDEIRDDFLYFIATARKQGKKIAGYGAAAKGNTLLNYCGIRHGVIDYICDLSPHKQGQLMPASHIPIVSPDRLEIDKPDYIIIFPWNIKDEIMEQLSYARKWGTKFVVAIPELEIF